MPSLVLAIKEFARFLRSEGELILTTPFRSLRHFARFQFAMEFNRHFCKIHLSEFGFQIVELLPNGSCFELLAQKCMVFQKSPRGIAYSRTFVESTSSNIPLLPRETQPNGVHLVGGRISHSSELVGFGDTAAIMAIAVTKKQKTNG
jgi:hypothetical protein